MLTVFTPCKKAPGKITRHHVLNDIIWRAFGAAGIPAIKQPSELDRQDSKHTDGLTLIPWRGGRPLIWDVTVVSPLAASYVDKAATNAGTVADAMSATVPALVALVVTRKTEKYSSLSSTYLFEPIAVENLGAFSSLTLNVLSDLGRRIDDNSGDAFDELKITLVQFAHESLQIKSHSQFM